MIESYLAFPTSYSGSSDYPYTNPHSRISLISLIDLSNLVFIGSPN
jgi:hypothetical protein